MGESERWWVQLDGQEMGPFTLDQLVALGDERPLREPVDRAGQLEAVEHREVPLELVAVAHNQRHLP